MQKQFLKLSFKYKNIKKNVFIDRYEYSNIFKNCPKILKIIKNLKPYLIEFEKDKFIKIKNYLKNCMINSYIRQFIIIIEYNKCIFFINNRI